MPGKRANAAEKPIYTSPFDLTQTIFTVPEAATYLRLSKASMYRVIKAGSLKTFAIGGNVRVHGIELKRFADQSAGL